jgi:hypothetical protein
LPSGWTQESGPAFNGGSTSIAAGSHAARWQAISFFTVGLLLSAWIFQRLWQLLREALTWLPVLDYRRSLSFILLWGMLFVIVLTMISGARELMTPGAWRKQGWTYKLAESGQLSESGSPLTPSVDPAIERANALKRLRFALWQYAATHQGQFPDREEPSIQASLWDVPGYPGVQFIYLPNQSTDDTDRLLVIEPQVDGDTREVVMTNGQTSTMGTQEILHALGTERKP